MKTTRPTPAPAPEVRDPRKGNSVLTLHPYKEGNTWYFDTPEFNIYHEAFVLGINDMIDMIVAEKKIPNAEKGIALRFAANAFPGSQVAVEWMFGDKFGKHDRMYISTKQKFPKSLMPTPADLNMVSGNWYYCEKLKIRGWLCPTLFAFFDPALGAPEWLHCAADPLSNVS